MGGGSGGLVTRLHHSEPAATSMLGNFTLIRENKEGAGLRGGTCLGTMAPPHPEAGAAGEGTGRHRDGGPFGTLTRVR